MGRKKNLEEELVYSEMMWRRMRKHLKKMSLPEFVRTFNTSYLFLRKVLDKKGYDYKKYIVLEGNGSFLDVKKDKERICHYRKCSIKKDLIPIEKVYYKGKSCFKNYLCQEHFRKWVKIVGESYFYLREVGYGCRSKLKVDNWEKLWKAFIRGKVRKNKRVFVEKG